MKKKGTLPKIVMAASVAAMGGGLFQAVDVEAQSADAVGVCCHWLYTSCPHPSGGNYADSKWFGAHSTCDTVHC